MSTDWTLARLLPEFDRRTSHTRIVAAPPAAVWQAAMSVTAAELTALKPLLAVRHGKSPRLSGSLIDGAVPIPLLATIDGREVVFGTIGKFWRPRAARPPAGAGDPGRFHEFAEPDWAKAAMSISVAPGPGDTTLLATETRVRATSPGARRLFLCYWPFVALGSRLIRVDVLRAIARRAERESG